MPEIRRTPGRGYAFLVLFALLLGGLVMGLFLSVTRAADEHALRYRICSLCTQSADCMQDDWPLAYALDRCAAPTASVPELADQPPPEPEWITKVLIESHDEACALCPSPEAVQCTRDNWPHVYAIDHCATMRRGPGWLEDADVEAQAP